MFIKIEEKIRENVDALIKELGFEIEYIEFVKEGSSHILRIALDKKDQPISIDDCENVSRNIDEQIESIMKDQAYVLEVCSAGLERQLKNINLYDKYMGYDVHVKLFKKLEFGKEFDAKIVGVDNVDKEVTFEKLIDNKNNKLKVNLKDIASAYTIYDFEADFKSNK